MKRILCLAAAVVVSLIATAGAAQSQQWQTVSVPTTVKDVAIWGSVWILGTNDQVYTWSSSGWSPHATPVEAAVSVVVGPDQRPFVNERNRWKVYKSTGSGWSELPGNAATLGVDGRSFLWSRQGGGRYFHYCDGREWQNGQVGYGNTITFNSGGVAVAIGNGGRAHRVVNGEWQDPEGKAVIDIAIDDRAHIWTVEQVDRNVHRHDGARWFSYPMPAGVQASRIAVTGAGQPFRRRDGRTAIHVQRLRRRCRATGTSGSTEDEQAPEPPDRAQWDLGTARQRAARG